LRKLSVFIDESGDFGAYEYHSPYYIVTIVFHDQSIDISPNLNEMQERMRQHGIPDYTVHAGPLIRREEEYENLSVKERKGIFDRLYHFIRLLDITYHPIIIDKKQLIEETDLNARLSKQLSAFLRENTDYFTSYDNITVYYDYGQMELTNILVTLFNAFLSNVEFRKVTPANYKLFQASDMLCTLELLALKSEKKLLTKSELKFFKSAKDLYKSYIKAIQKKRI
jgi:hypothetical protein